MASGLFSMFYNLRGPNFATCSACATANHAIGEAWRAIKMGDAQVMFAGGAEAAVVPVGIGGFCAMRAMSTRNDDPKHASRPFDKERDGFVMGEGAGILVLEEWEHALARGATIYAEVLGAASTADAHHITAPDPSGHGAIRCMELALEDAVVTPSEVSHINAHGTSTPLNDLAESVAVRAVFGDDPPPVTSIKGHLGHSLAAAGALEGVVSVLTLVNQLIPPTAGTTKVDPDVGLNVVIGEALAANVEVVLSNSFGFGGHNGSVVFRRFHA
jgi:3-oxoacyl-[acyl-carrier-protein] synthase II